MTIGTLKAIVRLKRASNRASGLRWKDAGERAPEKGIRLSNEVLAEALKEKAVKAAAEKAAAAAEFAPREWEAKFGALELKMEHF
eukprot:3893172-Prymnesium_polylepis.1